MTSIEPHWKEELAEIRSRPDTDPYQIAINKIYNLLEGVASEELKSILCMAIWKQAIEPLVDSEMGKFSEWIASNGIKQDPMSKKWFYIPKTIMCEGEMPTTQQLIELYKNRNKV